MPNLIQFLKSLLRLLVKLGPNEIPVSKISVALGATYLWIILGRHDKQQKIFILVIRNDFTGKIFSLCFPASRQRGIKSAEIWSKVFQNTSSDANFFLIHLGNTGLCKQRIIYTQKRVICNDPVPFNRNDCKV